MKIFNSASIYSCSLPEAYELQKHLEDNRMNEITEAELSKSGWIDNSATEELVSSIGSDWTAITLQFDEKILPAENIRKEWMKRLDKFEKELERSPYKEEAASLKSDVIVELCARALVKTRVIQAFYNHTKKQLIVATATPRIADVFMSKLLHSVGSITSQTIHISGIKDGLTKRLRDHIDNTPDSFVGMTPSSKCKLSISNEDGKETISFTGSDMSMHEIGCLIDQQYEVELLGLETESFYFVLDKNFKFKSISNFCYEPSEEAEDKAQLWQHEALDQLTHMQHAIDSLCEMFEYKAELEEAA